MQAYPCYLEVAIEALTDLKIWGLSKVVGLEMLGNNEKCQDFKGGGGGFQKKKWIFQCAFLLFNLRCSLEKDSKKKEMFFWHMLCDDAFLGCNCWMKM